MMSQPSKATALTIAGSDPSGGAGLQADLKTFQTLNCYGMSVVTLLTVQNTVGVQHVELISPALILQQMDAVLRDIPPTVIKTGALGTAEIIGCVAERLKLASAPIVADPVLVSKHGHPLADHSAITAYKEHLLPICSVLTPNRFEAEALIGRKLTTRDEFEEAAGSIRSMGPKIVVLKAGHRDGFHEHFIASETGVEYFSLASLTQTNTHGAGCVLSAAIAGLIALHLAKESPTGSRSSTPNFDLASSLTAIRKALIGVHLAIENGPRIGAGIGPLAIDLLSDHRPVESLESSEPNAATDIVSS